MSQRATTAKLGHILAAAHTHVDLLPRLKHRDRLDNVIADLININGPARSVFKALKLKNFYCLFHGFLS